MNAKRAYFLMCGLVVLFLVALVGGAYEINGLLGQKSQKLVNTKAKLESLNQQEISLTKSKKDIVTYSDLYKISRTIVPENKNQAEAVRQIINLASASGVSIQSVTFPPSTLGGGAAAASRTGSTSSSATTASPSAAGGAGASLSQLTKVPNIPGVYMLPLTVSGGNATYQQLISFLSELEQNRLTALVSQISIAPAKDASTGSATSGRFTFQLDLDIYIKP